jgi:hypothetical protein
MFNCVLGVLDMDKWLKVSVVVAVLLAGAGAFHYFVFALPGIDEALQRRESGARRLDEFRLAQRRSAIEDCRQAAQMVYAVHWAAACMTQVGQAPSDPSDGDAECDLPDAKAAVVNAWLDEAEQACMADVRAGLDP